MNIVYDKGNVTIYYIPTDKFKNTVVDIYFCDNLDKDRAYMNALIPRILERGSVNYDTFRKKSRFLKTMYGAACYSGVDLAGEIQYTNYTLDYVDNRYIHVNENNIDIEEKLFEYIIEQITKPVTEDYNGVTGFKKEYFYQEIQRQNEQIESIINDKQSYAVKCLIEEMCRDEVYSVSYLGEVSDSVSLTPEKLYDYYVNYYLKCQSIKIFYSSNSKPDKLISMFTSEPVFSQNKIKADCIGFRQSYKDTVGEVIKKMDVTQGKLVVGFRTNVPPESNDYYALVITNGILGSGTQSKLFRNVREANSMAYYAYSSTRRFKGLLIASAGIDTSNKEAVYDLIIGQLEDIKNGIISDDEIDAAKSACRNSMNSKYDTQYSLIDFYLTQAFFEKIYEPDYYKEQFDKVTKEDCIRIARNIVPDTIVFLTSNE